MACRSVIFLALLSLAAGIILREGNGATVPYHGPPAPLNHDGTVAFTPEIQKANAHHHAAYAEELKRLEAVESLAAAHPDRTSPPSPDYDPSKNGQYNNGQYQQQYNNGQYNQQQEDDGQYKPHLYENEQSSQQYNSVPYNQQQYSSVPYNQQQYTPILYNQQQYNQHSYNQGSPYNKQAHVPAPLNADGTAAQTPEFNAIAATLQAAYQQALVRHRRSAARYHGPPAPLNHDGTVANTPEVQHANAIHKAAYTHEYHRLQHAGSLAAAHPDLTSPPEQHYETWKQTDNDQYNSQQEDDGKYKPHLYDDGEYKPHLYEKEDYNSQQDEGQYNSYHYSQGSSYKYNPEAHIPAPLNHDGTVAHTAAYKAIAASHHAEYAKTLQNVKHESSVPFYQAGHY